MASINKQKTNILDKPLGKGKPEVGNTMRYDARR